MNKSVLGSVLGLALLSTLKSKSGSNQQKIILDTVYGTENGQIKVVADVEYWATIIDKNSGRSNHETDYECRTDWLKDSKQILRNLKNMQSHSEQWFIDNGIIADECEGSDIEAFCTAFDLSPTIFWNMDISDALSQVLPSRIELKNIAVLDREDLIDAAVEICSEYESVDECYDNIPEQYIEEVVSDWKNTEFTHKIEFYFDVTEETINFEERDFLDSVTFFLEVVETTFNDQIKEERLKKRQFGSPYRIEQALSIMDISISETIPSDLPLILNKKESSIRRY